MSFETEESAPELITLKRLDAHRIWRVLLWGASATLAVAVVAVTALSEPGTDRLRLVLAAITEPSRSEAAPPTTSPQQIAAFEEQTRQLTQAVRELGADRDRLKGRLAILEQNLDDITGAIKKQDAQIVELPKLNARIAPPPPAVSPPSTIVAAASPTPPPPQTVAAPPVEVAPPMAQAVPLPPTRVATAEPGPPPAEAAPSAVTRLIGLDLGGAVTPEGLRTHWATLKANIGPDLIGLRANMTTRRTPAGAIDYRLIAGPFANSAAAIRLCTKLAASKLYCRAGLFNVQQLAER